MGLEVPGVALPRVGSKDRFGVRKTGRMGNRVYEFSSEMGRVGKPVETTVLGRSRRVRRGLGVCKTKRPINFNSQLTTNEDKIQTRSCSALCWENLGSDRYPDISSKVNILPMCVVRIAKKLTPNWWWLLWKTRQRRRLPSYPFRRKSCIRSPARRCITRWTVAVMLTFMSISATASALHRVGC
jgi:hypothetical protein